MTGSDKPFEIRYAPGFAESMANVPEEEREEVMEAVRRLTEEIQRNPHIGTPVGRSPLFVFTNWLRRQYRRVSPRRVA